MTEERRDQRKKDMPKKNEGRQEQPKAWSRKAEDERELGKERTHRRHLDEPVDDHIDHDLGS